MTGSDYRDPRLTEQRNPRTERIDVASSLEIVDLMNAEDATVAGAVRRERERIAAAIDLADAAVVWCTSGRGRRGGWACSMPPNVRRPSGRRRRWWWASSPGGTARWSRA